MNNEINETYTYAIYPNIPIKDLIPGKLINKPVSLQLTKKEVLHCMKFGPVYRIMRGKKPIRVTGSNIDELHKSAQKQEIFENTNNYSSDEEIEQNQEEVVQEDTKTDIPEEDNLNQEQEVVENTPVSEPVEEVENNTEESTTDNEEPAEDTLEVNEIQDEESDDTNNVEVSNDNSTNNQEKYHINSQQFKSNYNKKKKHR